MRNILLALTVMATLITTTLSAQEKNGVQLGVNINQFQKDFGLGIHVNSPYFFQGRNAIRIGANVQWLEHIGTDNEYTWSPYSNLQLGIRTRHYIIENKIFIYGEGGVTLLLPNNKFSSKNAIEGGYGLFGFELIMNHKMSYIIEIGGMGTGARADKVINNPIYSNGLMIGAGFRMHL